MPTGGSRLPIRRALYASLLATCIPPCVSCGFAQTPSLLPATPPQVPAKPPEAAPAATSSDLPNAPGLPLTPQDVTAVARSAFEITGDPAPPLASDHRTPWQTRATYSGPYGSIQRKRAIIFSDQRFLNDEFSVPMTSRQKAFVAATDFSDPGNLAIIAASAAIYTASNSHSAYGPGVMGFGRNYGYSLSQDATGEFFGTWLIPSVAHQDPRYHRMPGAPLGTRLLHALAHTVIAQSDAGATIPNYATLLTYPLSAEIANLYVPGLHTNGSSTAKRVIIGLASDPSDALIGEFLPDVARRVHIRVTFFQQIINDISTDHPL